MSIDNDPRPRPRVTRVRAHAGGLHPVYRARRLARRVHGGHSRRRILAVLGGLVVVGALFLYGGSQVALAVLETSFGGMPDAHQFASDSVVLDRNGTVIAELHPPGDMRSPVPLTRVSPTLQVATVAIEDRNFWNEGAIDPTRLLSAAWDDLRHQSAAQGASTITEQLAKVRYLGDEKTITRKLHEIFIARHLEQTMSKPEILDEYLNDIYYGHGATGIQAAARIYFGTDALHLDLAEAAMLAGLPNAPTLLDPIVHLDAARARQLEVLNAMVAVGDITRAQADEAYAEKLPLTSGQMPTPNLAPAFVSRVVDEVRSKLNLDPYTAGLTITTTLNLSLQNTAQKIVTQQVDSVHDLNVTDGALVSVDPQTGEILSYVGGAGPGHPGSEIDMASQPRQPGSTFKLFTYSTALAEKRLTMTTPILDAPYSLPDGSGGIYTVHNYDQRYHGLVPAEEALGNSLNIPAVKVEMVAGIPDILKTARAMGVTTLNQPDNSYGASMTLGSYPVPLWQMAQAAGVIAAQGMLHPAHTLRSVVDQSGHELLPGAARARQALDPGVAFIMNQILTNDANRVMEFGANSALTLPDHRVAAKTGTTQNFRDNLTVGWTPHLATAAWVGNADNEAMHGTTGITGAAPIWHDDMEQVLRSVPDDWPGPPADVRQGVLYGRPGWFLVGSTAAGVDVLGSGYCRTWIYNGRTYYFCGPQLSNLPGDPGPGAGAVPPPPPSPVPVPVPPPGPPPKRHHH